MSWPTGAAARELSAAAAASCAAKTAQYDVLIHYDLGQVWDRSSDGTEHTGVVGPLQRRNGGEE